MKINIIIATYNRPKLLVKCIASILGDGYNQKYASITVWDDGSNLSQLPNILSWEKQGMIHYNKGGKNSGYPGYPKQKGYIASIKKFGKPDVAIFLDDDAIVLKDCIKNLAQFIMKNKYVGKLAAYGSLSGFPPFRIDHEAGKVTKEYLGAGVCYAIRGDVFDEVGGFDISGNCQREDLEISMRLYLTGYKILVLFSADVKHKRHQKGGMAPDTRVDSFPENMAFFKRKYSDSFTISKNGRVVRNKISKAIHEENRKEKYGKEKNSRG